MEFTETDYGFIVGPIEVTRLLTTKDGHVFLEFKTKKETLQISSSKTGKVRVHSKGGKEWKKD